MSKENQETETTAGDKALTVSTGSTPSDVARAMESPHHAVVMCDDGETRWSEDILKD